MQNPFSTSATLPGKIEYIFPDDTTIDSLNVSLATHNYRSQIVGPHGTGKSTLIRTLIPHLENEFEIIELNPRELSEQDEIPVFRIAGQRFLLVIDGIEQITPALTTRLLHWLQGNEAGILCTCHEPIDGVPVLWTTRSNLETFQQLVKKLSQRSLLVPHHDELLAIFNQQNGNIRECLFDLYDWFEAK